MKKLILPSIIIIILFSIGLLFYLFITSLNKMYYSEGKKHYTEWVEIIFDDRQIISMELLEHRNNTENGEQLIVVELITLENANDITDTIRMDKFIMLLQWRLIDFENVWIGIRHMCTGTSDLDTYFTYENIIDYEIFEVID